MTRSSGTLIALFLAIVVAAVLPQASVSAVRRDHATATGSATAPLATAANNWLSQQALLRPRRLHDAATLPDGRVLVAGGIDDATGYIGTAEIFDPFQNTWASKAALHTNRIQPVAVLLPSTGNVLLVGGYRPCDPPAVPCAPDFGGFGDNFPPEYYDVSADTWIQTPHLLVPRSRGHTATVIGNQGKVAVVGGTSGYNSYTAAVEIYDPDINSWASGPALPEARDLHTATRLNDGRMLVVGGYASSAKVHGDSLLFDGSSWTTPKPLPGGAQRWGHAAALLASGKVLVTGGYPGFGSIVPAATSFLYDPVDDSWQTVQPMTIGRGGHQMVALDDGTALVAGGCVTAHNVCSGQPTDFVATTELYRPGVGWSAAGDMNVPRLSATLTALPGVAALLVGGQTNVNQAVNAVEMYGDPELAALPCAPIPPDMTAWWPLDATSGTTAADIWVNTNDGTVSGPPGWDPAGMVNGAHYFNGTGASHIDVPDDPSLNYGTGDFAVDAWVRLSGNAADGNGTRALVDKRQRLGKRYKGYHLYHSQYGGGTGGGTSVVGIQLADGVGFSNYFGTVSPTINDGQWHHVAATVKRTAGPDLGVRLYVDGVLIKSSPSARPGSVTNTSHLRLGANAFGGQYFKGWLDEVQLYARALSAAEVQSIFDAGSLGKCPPPCEPPGPPGGAGLSLAPGYAVALPALNRLGLDDVCSAWVQVQNGGAVGTHAVLLTWSDTTDCASAGGPVGVSCSGLIAPGSAWAFADQTLPAGSLSGIVYTFADGSYGGNPIADTLCTYLTGITTDAQYRAFHEAYLTNGTVAGIPMSAARGESLAVAVHRTCPADITPGARVSSAYEGISEAMLQAPASDSPPRYRYRVPLILNEKYSYYSYLYLQNSGTECAQIQVAFRLQDSCLPAAACQLGSSEVPPGQTLSIDPYDCVSFDWQGDVEIESNVPLAVAADLIGRDSLSTYRGVSAVPSPGADDLVGPLMYHPQTGWSTWVQVQNLGCEEAEARVTFHDDTGAVIATQTDTLCPSAAGTFLLPVSSNIPGVQTGWIRVESLADNVQQKQPLAAVAWLIKYSDVQLTEVREASAYNLLPVRELSGGKVGLPMMMKDLGSSGLTSEIQLTGGPHFGAGSGGTETIQRTFFDATAVVASDTLPLSVGTSLYEVIHNLGIVPNYFRGSAILADTGSRARFGAAGVVRSRTLITSDLPGDESATYVGIPLGPPTE